MSPPAPNPDALPPESSPENRPASCLELRPELSDLPRLMEFVERFAAEYGLYPSDENALAVAAEELFANTINHSRPPATAVRFALHHGIRVVEAVYQDNGAPFDPVQHAQVDTTLPSAERRIGGLGIHFIRRSMRSMRHQRLNGWNITLFERELIPHKS